MKSQTIKMARKGLWVLVTLCLIVCSLVFVAEGSLRVLCGEVFSDCILGQCEGWNWMAVSCQIWCNPPDLFTLITCQVPGG